MLSAFTRAVQPGLKGLTRLGLGSSLPSFPASSVSMNQFSLREASTKATSAQPKSPVKKTKAVAAYKNVKHALMPLGGSQMDEFMHQQQRERPVRVPVPLFNMVQHAWNIPVTSSLRDVLNLVAIHYQFSTTTVDELAENFASCKTLADLIDLAPQELAEIAANATKSQKETKVVERFIHHNISFWKLNTCAKGISLTTGEDVTLFCTCQLHFLLGSQSASRSLVLAANPHTANSKTSPKVGGSVTRWSEVIPGALYHLGKREDLTIRKNVMSYVSTWRTKQDEKEIESK